MKLEHVTLNGNYFTAGSKRFIPIGVHLVPAKTGLNWLVDWDEKDIEKDFVKMSELGINMVRFDLFWAWVEPRPGSYNPKVFTQMAFLISLAHKYGIYLNPTFFIGGEVGEAYWDVPWRNGRHPHSDSDMLRFQTEHVAEFGRRYKGESAIIAWDLNDEPPFWVVRNITTDAMAINWTRLLTWSLRRVDPDHLICVGTDVSEIGRGPFRPDTIKEEVDFFSSHPYPIYNASLFPDPMLSERGSYAAAFQTLLSMGAGRPLMLQEFGASSAQYSPQNIALYDRVTMYSGLAAGSNSFVPWCYTDAAPELYKQVPYLRGPHETQFGITTWDRKDRPSGVETKEFSDIVSQMNFEGVEPALGEGAIIVPWEWAKPFGDFSKLGLTGPNIIPFVSVQEEGGSNHDQFESDYRSGEDNNWLMGAMISSFILARRAGAKVELPREYSDWQKYSFVLLPSPLTSTEKNVVHVHTSFWEQAREYVSKGGVLYASVCADTAIPDMGDLFGATLADHSTVSDVELTLTADFGGLSKGTTFCYTTGLPLNHHWGATLEVAGGEVIAVDQNGNPAIIAHTYGKGKTLFSAYPIESYLAVTPSAFEKEENTHLLYKALLKWGEINPLFSSDCKSVEVSGLIGKDRGYAVVASHSPQKQKVTVSSRISLKTASLVNGNGLKEVQHSKDGFTLELDRYGCAVVQWSK